MGEELRRADAGQSSSRQGQEPAQKTPGQAGSQRRWGRGPSAVAGCKEKAAEDGFEILSPGD